MLIIEGEVNKGFVERMWEKMVDFKNESRRELLTDLVCYSKLVSAIFIKFLFFQQMIALQKL